MYWLLPSCAPSLSYFKSGSAALHTKNHLWWLFLKNETVVPSKDLFGFVHVLYYRLDNGGARFIRSRDVTSALWAVISQMLTQNMVLDIHQDKVDTCSLQAGGATTLICGSVDDYLFQLIGRWKSDAMIRYLHISANPAIHSFTKKCFTMGTTRFGLASWSKLPTNELTIHSPHGWRTRSSSFQGAGWTVY